MIEKIPPELREVIEAQKKHIREANIMDNKTTSQQELDRVEEDYRDMYERGLAFIKTLPLKEAQYCRRLYNLRSQYGAESLRTFPIDKQWALVPAYITLINEVRQLAKDVFLISA